MTAAAMSHLWLALLLASPSAARGQDSTAQPPDHASHQVFVIPRFTFETGAIVPNVRINYGTYGRLDAAHSNAILLPSHYMADHHGYDWLIGPGRALDTTRYFLVATELFGNGHSSSPSNTPAPFHGPKFPVATIRDNVEAVHRLLVERLGITRLQAIIGFSMGAEQAFQWAVSYPDFSPRIVATAGTARCWPHGVVRLESQIAALQLDPAFKGGNYTVKPKRGLQTFGLVWAPWLYSQEWWRRELWRKDNPAARTLSDYLNSFAENWTQLDANDAILQARTWQRHDVGSTNGFGGSTENALKSIRAAVLYMPSETDLYFPVGDARYEAGFIPHVTLTPIPSLWGHPAGAGADSADTAFLNQHIAAFLAAAPSPPPK
jgi:homoserine O-acetyltransferase/O-succinyltransferase